MIEKKLKTIFAVTSAILFFVFISKAMIDFTPTCTQTKCIYPDTTTSFLKHGWIFALSIASTFIFLFFLKQQRHKEFKQKWNN